MGTGKAGGEWILVCLTHNIKKIYAKIVAKGDEGGKNVRANEISGRYYLLKEKGG